MQRKQHIEKGFSLIEVLVTLIIVSIGVMGVIGMQLMSARNVNNAEMRSLASYFAYDMAERMRANPTGVTAGNYSAIDGSETDPGNSCTSACSAAELAAYDAFIWNDMINNSIASNDGSTPRGLGVGAIGKVTLAAGVYTIDVSWNEQDRNADGGTLLTQSLSIEFLL